MTSVLLDAASPASARESESNIADLLRARAAERPGQPAIVHGQRSLTFAELDDLSARYAAVLRARGLARGDRVLVLVPMSPELYALLGALFRAGLVAVFLDPSAGRAHVDRSCAVAAPRAFVGTPKAHLLRLVVPALRRVGLAFVVGGYAPGATRLDAGAARFAGVEPCGLETPALLTFTSGSTGEPKAAVRSHGFLRAQHRALAASLSLAAGDADLTTLPIFALSNLASGVTSLIPECDLRRPGAADPAPIARRILQAGATSVAASPALLERVVEYCEGRGLTLDSLERVFTGGAPVFPRLLDALARVAPRARVTAVYGSTEAEPIAHVALDEISTEDRRAMRTGSGLLAGRPAEGVMLRVLRDRWGSPRGPFTPAELESETLATGEIGEIVVSGDHVLRGYLGGRGDGETKISVGGDVWHRTGDAGYMDGRGRVWLLGRCSAAVRDARGAVHPFAVECAASENAFVARSALVGLAGRRVLAVEPRGDGLDAGALLEALAGVGVDEVRVLRSIPVDARHNAKVDYPALTAALRAD